MPFHGKDRSLLIHERRENGQIRARPTDTQLRILSDNPAKVPRAHFEREIQHVVLDLVINLKTGNRSNDPGRVPTARR